MPLWPMPSHTSTYRISRARDEGSERGRQRNYFNREPHGRLEVEQDVPRELLAIERARGARGDGRWSPNELLLLLAPHCLLLTARCLPRIILYLPPPATHCLQLTTGYVLPAGDEAVSYLPHTTYYLLLGTYD